MCLSVGVIGAGIIAEEHFQAIRAITELHAIAVADIDEKKARKVASKYGTKNYTDYQYMVEKEVPDIVIITLPHYLHKDAAIFSAEQGCHILLEKPMALNVTECEEIIQSAIENRVQLMVGHIQKYFQENIVAKQIIEQRQLGSLVMINEMRHLPYFTRKRPGWFLDFSKSGGGIVMNLGAHCIDKIQWMLDTRFSQVLSKLTYKSDEVGVSANVEGSGLLYIETEKGIPITISLSGYDVVPKHITELIFTNGMMIVEAGKGVWVSKNGVYEKMESTQEISPFERQLTEFIRAIKGNSAISDSGQYAKSVIQVIEAGYQSHQQELMVQLPPETGERRVGKL